MKLIEIYSSIDVPMKAYCKQYLRHQISVKNHVYILWEYLLNHTSEAREKDVQQLQSAIGHKGSMSSFRNIMSKLSNLLEEAIVCYQLEKEDGGYYKHLMLARHYKKTGSISLFKKQIQTLLNIAHSQSPYDPQRLAHLYLGYYESVFSELKYEEKHEDLDNLGPIAEDISRFCHQYLAGYVVSLPSKFSFDTDHKVMAASTTQLQKLMTTMYRLQTEKSADDYNIVLTILHNNWYQMPGHMGQLALQYLLNHCMIMIKKGNSNYYRDLLELTDFGFETRLLLSQEKLSEQRFINAVELKSYFNSDEEVRLFISNWLKVVHTDCQESINLLAQTFYHFGKGRYDDASISLSAVTISSGNYKLQFMTRWLNLCICSVSNNEERFLHLVSIVERYLYRIQKKVNRRHIESTKNLILVLKLIRKSNSPTLIKRKIAKMDNLVMRYWITKRIEELHAIHSS